MSSANGTTKQVAGEKMTFGQVAILELGNRELMRVQDDPKHRTPIRIGFQEFNCYEAAAIAAAIIRTIQHTHCPKGVDELHELEMSADMLKEFAQSPQTPF